MDYVSLDNGEISLPVELFELLQKHWKGLSLKTTCVIAPCKLTKWAIPINKRTSRVSSMDVPSFVSYDLEIIDCEEFADGTGGYYYYGYSAECDTLVEFHP